MTRGRLCRSLWPVLVLVALYAASVLLFTTSMLSTSTVVRTVATAPCRDTGVPPVDQVVLVLIDAMRPDFVLSALRPFARTGGQCTAHEDDAGHQRLDDVYAGPTLHYMEASLRSSQAAAVAFFLVADAPTTTAQRIKAIATGTMPAFLEAGSNFNSDAIDLDSIVGQMNGSAVLLGDDTWEKLFPNTAARRHWKRAVGIPSFDVADFHTNDDAVLAEVFDVLTTETAEAVAAAGAAADGGEGDGAGHARLVVAHFLGIDHVGHRIDSDNPFMQGKILQLDQMLRNVSRTLQERTTSMRTMLLVLGDHGMTNSGDHGGGSAQETDTFLYAEYFAPPHPRPEEAGRKDKTRDLHSAPGANLASAQTLIDQRWRAGVDGEFSRLRSCHARAGVPPDRLGATYQVDVTTTMALLLGKPIPYSSFGRVIPEVLALANATADVAAAERCNLAQLQRYFREAAVKVPREAAWTRPGASVTQQIADMSFFLRRTRTDMNRAGMFAGSTGLLLCALSLLWSPVVRAHVLPRGGCGRGDGGGGGAGWCMRWTAAVLLLRLCAVFSNSFVVNEDSEVLGLLSSLLLLLIVPRLVAWARASLTPRVPAGGRRAVAARWLPCAETVFMVLLLVGLRLAVPRLLRYRAHITHTVETESAVDRALAGLLPALLRPERAGIVTGGVVWSALYPRLASRRAVALTCGCLALAYHVHVAHHAAPVLCIVVRFVAQPKVARSAAAPPGQRGSCAAYAYMVAVLWLTSLCNARVATAVVVALYGASLPFLCRVLRAEPALTQAVVLHLAAFAAFFAEGHQCMLNAIDWNASFVGMPRYNLYAGGILVLSRTFHAFLLVPWALCIWPAATGDVHAARGVAALEDAEATAAAARHKKDEEAVASQPPRATASGTVVVVLYVYMMVVQSAVSCFNGYVQKTHLMLFPIFCPKLLFDGVVALLTCAATLVVLLVTSPADAGARGGWW